MTAGEGVQMQVPETLAALLRKSAANADAPFLLGLRRPWTYGEFAAAVDAFAAGLALLGVKQSDRVAIAAPNSAEWLITWFAVAKLGAVLVTLNVAYREREFEHMLNQSDAMMLVCCSRDAGFDFVDFIDRLRPRFEGVRQFVFLGDAGFEGSHRWEDVLAAVPATGGVRVVQTEIRPDDAAVILYTSGTTGEPKGATLTHASILASAAAQAAHLDQNAHDAVIGHMPLNHVGGMTCTVVATMISGGQVVLLPKYSPSAALEAIRTHRVTVFVGVPTMYTLLFAEPAFGLIDSSCIRLCIVGGSNVDPILGRQILDTFAGARLANLYGLSETSGGCIISEADDDLDALLTTLGVPIGNFEARIATEQGEALAVGQEGELQLRGRCVAAGYWERPDESAQAFLADGWFATGDLAQLRPDGRVVLRGRKKEMYVRGGFNVYPVEVENVLRGDDAVAMCAVIGMPDPKYGETGLAYIVPAPGKTIDIDRLLTRCRRELAKYKIPDRIEVVQSLPLTPAGKIRKFALRQGVPGK